MVATSSASSTTGIIASGVDEQLFTVVAVDALARDYRDRLRLYGTTYPTEPVSGQEESLHKQFNSGSFDIGRLATR